MAATPISEPFRGRRRPNSRIRKNEIAGIDAAVCDLRVLLEWVERDEKDGVGEAAYPPNFPKMPGEPPRVQPSRARQRPD